MIAFELARRTKEYARLLLTWRSDEHARKMSINQQPMSEDAFWDYFKKYFYLKDLPPLIAWMDGKQVAFVGFDPYEEAAEISIVLPEEYRGKGIGSKVLQEVSKFVSEQGYSKLYAEIRPENSASIKAFEKAGFVFEKEFEKKGNVLKLYAKEFYKMSSKKAFIIGEAGSNWRISGNDSTDFDQACKMIEVAKEAGCDAVKFQVFRAKTLYVPNAGSADYMEKMGIATKMEDIFEELSMPYEMIPRLAKRAEDVGIEFMATPFSKEDFLAVDPYVKRHKIGSYELGHIRLLELAAKSKKPLYLSTGVSKIEDIEWAARYYKDLGGVDLTLLQCCAEYPAHAAGMHLAAIAWMRSYFQVPTGLSDHSVDPVIAPVAAISLGATVVEKHFTLSKKLSGPDHSFAVEPDELKAMCAAIRQAEVMLGSQIKQVAKEEMELYSFARRGIQAIRPIKKGDRFVEDQNIAILRPGKQKIGIAPRCIDQVVGKLATRDISVGEGIEQDDFK